MERFLLICLAGAAGAATRYLVNLWTVQRFGTGFPVGTLVVNMIGCFGIAVAMQAASALGWPATLRMAITVGFIGGLTTYSSFNYETIDLVERGAAGAALLYVALTMAGGLLAGWLGLLVSRQFR